MTFYFGKKYLLLTLFFFSVEIGIALFVKDTLIRPFIGDVLVVILIYCFLRIFLNPSYWKVALGALLFACAIEILQYFDYVKLLGLEQNRVLSVALGRTFEWLDFIAYLTGFLFIAAVENFSKAEKIIIIYEPRHKTNPPRRRIKQSQSRRIFARKVKY